MLPLVLLLVVALVEVAITARTQLELVNAAREGAREAAVSPDPAAASAASRAALGDLASAARVSVRRPAIVGRAATVEIVLRHRFAAPLFGGFAVSLKARSAMRVER